MKVLLIGGHLSPALCVIEELSKSDEVIYVGRKHALEGDKSLSLEYKTIRNLDIPFLELKTGRLQRSFSKHTIPSLLRIPYGFLQALKILKNSKPDVVVGFGGYLSFPIIWTSNLLKIPIVIHEQTLEAGMANKHLAKYADKICISFEESENYFPKEKVVLTGNPVRKSIRSPKEIIKIELKEPIIFITGGSTGSQNINQLVMATLPKILQKSGVIHQTGSFNNSSDFNKLQILKDGLNKDKKDKYMLAENFPPDIMGSIYKKASLVVGRAGINTVTELISIEKPALLIPLLTTQKSEQIRNANYFKNLGLGEVLDKKNIEAEVFLKEIYSMLEHLEKYKLNTRDIPVSKNSAKKIVKIIYETVKKNNN